MERIKVDIAIVGAGISGLWLHRILQDIGYESILIEKSALGAGQTITAQGMIHGGQRYQLQGASNAHGTNIAAMPKIWQQCFDGTGVIDLSNTKILAPNQFLWSPGGMLAGVATFMASKAMNSRVKALPTQDLPDIFCGNTAFKGKVYEMDECVVDIKSLIKEISGDSSKTALLGEVVSISGINKADINENRGFNLKLVCHNQQKQTSSEVTITTKLLIYTAGIGNEFPVKNFALNKSTPITQRRPLKQVIVKEVDIPFYAHCITTDPRPRVTITAHPMDSARQGFYWYLGGIVAEYGLDRSDLETIEFAKKELQALFPLMNWEKKKWACVEVDRAEPFFDKSYFKSGPELLTKNNLAIGWPTKLTYAPALADMILKWVDSRVACHQMCSPTDGSRASSNSHSTKIPIAMQTSVPIAKYPWETAFWVTPD